MGAGSVEVVETRELRYFLGVADERHFGRAAMRLGIAQPPLSRAIGRLERRLGGRLFERSSRGVSLTAAGEVLAREGQTALAAVEAAERRTRRAAVPAEGANRIVLTTKAGASSELLAKLLDAYAAEPDAVPVEVMLCTSGEQQRVLHDGRADVALLHLPFDSVDGLDTEVLTTEGQVAVLPAGHPLTTRTHLTRAEVEQIPGLPGPRHVSPDGTIPDGPGPSARDALQLLELIALGRASAIVPESGRALLRPGLVAVPVPDAAPVTTVIAWPPDSRSTSVAALVRTATQL